MDSEFESEIQKLTFATKRVVDSARVERSAAAVIGLSKLSS
jgi:hypothetical protein